MQILEKVKEWAGVLALLAILATYGSSLFSTNLGYTTVATTALRYPNSYIDTAHGYYVDSVAVIDGTGDITATGGNLTVTTSNTATSTTAVGCIQTTATSTATPVRLVIGSSGATTTHQGTNSVGVVGWQYGSCPI